MHDLAVLFVHHADDQTTLNNLACLRHFNPGVPVVPLSNWGVTLADGFHVRDMTAGWRTALPCFRENGFGGVWGRLRRQFDRRWIWRNSDLAAYFWITWKRRPVQARRWVVFEWDMYANTRLSDWYRDNYDEAISSTFTQLPGRDAWSHFDAPEVARIPQPLQSFRMACTPWAGMLFAEASLEAVATTVRDLPYRNGFCELRVGTVAKSLGIDPVALRNPLAARTLRATLKFRIEDVDCPSVWHRVKEHATLNLTSPVRTARAPAAESSSAEAAVYAA